MFDVFVAGWKEGTACLARLETIPTVAMFIRACELQERCEGLRLRDFLLMPLQVGDVGGGYCMHSRVVHGQYFFVAFVFGAISTLYL